MLCLASLASAQPLEDEVRDLKQRLDGLELELMHLLERRQGELESLIYAEDGSNKFRSKKNLEEVLQLDETGESRRRDKVASFPEVSTFVAWTDGHRNLVNGLAVELFHKRDRPRKHNWMFKLMLGDEWVGFSAGYILIPVINFNVGPFVGKDLEERPGRSKETVFGLQASVFSF